MVIIFNILRLLGQFKANYDISSNSGVRQRPMEYVQVVVSIALLFFNKLYAVTNKIFLIQLGCNGNKSNVQKRDSMK